MPIGRRAFIAPFFRSEGKQVAGFAVLFAEDQK
jgi:hypothetical protein